MALEGIDGDTAVLIGFIIAMIMVVVVGIVLGSVYTVKKNNTKTSDPNYDLYRKLATAGWYMTGIPIILIGGGIGIRYGRRR